MRQTASSSVSRGGADDISCILRVCPVEFLFLTLLAPAPLLRSVSPLRALSPARLLNSFSPWAFGSSALGQWGTTTLRPRNELPKEPLSRISGSGAVAEVALNTAVKLPNVVPDRCNAKRSRADD